MKHMKTVVVPETTKEKVDRVTCDLCKQEMRDPDTYVVDEVSLQSKQGYNYPDSYHASVLEFDICRTCFDTRLIPWLKEQGAEPRVEEWDW